MSDTSRVRSRVTKSGFKDRYKLVFANKSGFWSLINQLLFVTITLVWKEWGTRSFSSNVTKFTVKGVNYNLAVFCVIADINMLYRGTVTVVRYWHSMATRNWFFGGTKYMTYKFILLPHLFLFIFFLIL